MAWLWPKPINRVGHEVNVFGLPFSMSGLLITITLSSSLALADPIQVNHKPILLNPDDPAQTRIGRLAYRGGLLLSSSDKNFGGFSGLLIQNAGEQITSLSDRGHWLRAELTYSESGHLTGIKNADLSPMRGLDGTPLRSKKQSDAEALSPGTNGSTVVGFERNHRLWRYSPEDDAPSALSPPRGLSKLKKNSGIEALTLLSNGQLLALAEGSMKKGQASGWIGGDQGWSSLTYQLTDGFRVTGATTHTNGDVFVLERFYTLSKGVAARIMHVPGHQITKGSILAGSLVAELRPPLNVDNFEGIDMRHTKDNRTFVYLISDDNFSFLQATLLMMFEVLAK